MDHIGNYFMLPPNGLRYWRWGGRGLCLGAEKTRSHAYAKRLMRSVLQNPQRSVRALLGILSLKQISKAGQVLFLDSLL
jgi:hypothetical protein